MVKLIEFEHSFMDEVILFNDENISEEEVMEIIRSGEFSSKIIIISKSQYENVFKSKNSIIKEIENNV